MGLKFCLTPDFDHKIQNYRSESTYPYSYIILKWSQLIAMNKNTFENNF